MKRYAVYRYQEGIRAADAPSETRPACEHHWHPTSNRPRCDNICCHCGERRSMIGPCTYPEMFGSEDHACGPYEPDARRDGR